MFLPVGKKGGEKMKFIMFLRNATGEQQTKRSSRRLAGNVAGPAVRLMN